MSLWNTIIAIDQEFNALTGGYPDETFSSRCWRCRDSQPFTTLVPIIDFFPRVLRGRPNHCKRAYESERSHADLPKELR